MFFCFSFSLWGENNVRYVRANCVGVSFQQKKNRTLNFPNASKHIDSEGILPLSGAHFIVH
jgi:hypothetical protein